MTLFFAVAIAVAAGLAVLLIVELVPARSPEVTRRVEEVAALHAGSARVERRRRKRQRDRLQEVLEGVGRQIRGQPTDTDGARELLIQAGYRKTGAPATYWGLRATLGLGLATIAAITSPLLGAGTFAATIIALYLGVVGYYGPVLVVRRKARARQKEITLALPDVLDLLVVCVEGGMALNQAFVRIAQESAPLSPITAEELRLLNLEIRAGGARDEALRNLATRTGVEDIRALSMMLIQADRFGTSIAHALRVHSETVRDKRRQRAEEAAAKTTIKMVFPLVLFIFPALMVVLIGPGFIQIFETFAELGR